jgi:dephospho-CoA kinase
MTLVVGLTGGIASGKSTVARLLAGLGARVVDADQLARRVVEVGTPGLAEIVEAFGAEMIGEDGGLDRGRLGRLIFSDDGARRRLEGITHPRIAAAFVEEVVRAAGEGVEVLVYEAALLVESGASGGGEGPGAVERLVVVAAPPAVQRRRVGERDGLDEEAAQARLDAQASLEAKIAFADHVIMNEGTLEALERKVTVLWEELLDVAVAREAGTKESG